MNWLKVAAVLIGALIAFLIVGEVVHIILALLGYVLIAALVAGGGYVAYKVLSSRRGREVRSRRRERALDEEHQRGEDRHEDLRQQGFTPYGPQGSPSQPQGAYPPQQGSPPPPPRPARPNVEEELNRLRREMGS